MMRERMSMRKERRSTIVHKWKSKNVGACGARNLNGILSVMHFDSIGSNGIFKPCKRCWRGLALGWERELNELLDAK
jgi:hypothetical protein